MSNVKIVSAWPCTGKSTLTGEFPIMRDFYGYSSNMIVEDLDSAVYKKYHNPDSNTWVYDYTEYVYNEYRRLKQSEIPGILLVSSHNDVQMTLLHDFGVGNNDLIIVMPVWQSKKTYLSRLLHRATASGKDGDMRAYEYMKDNFEKAYRDVRKLQCIYRDVKAVKLQDREFIAHPNIMSKIY